MPKEQDARAREAFEEWMGDGSLSGDAPGVLKESLWEVWAAAYAAGFAAGQEQPTSDE